MTSTESTQSIRAENTIEIHDPDYRFVLTVPLSCVHHMPPKHLDISRFVLCRNYNPAEPETSCARKSGCKFIHANIEGQVISTNMIHVHYAWRSPADCTYACLPEGELLHVSAPNNRCPLECIPSERIMVTRGSLARHEGEPLSHCAHFFFNRMCNRGEQCNFIHAAYVDANAKPFQRAPPRVGGGLVGTPASVAATKAIQDGKSLAPVISTVTSPIAVRSLVTIHADLSDDSDMEAGVTPVDTLVLSRSGKSSSTASTLSASARRNKATYRWNPYSLDCSAQYVQ